jgi:hypothetical protein
MCPYVNGPQSYQGFAVGLDGICSWGWFDPISDPPNVFVAIQYDPDTETFTYIGDGGPVVNTVSCIGGIITGVVVTPADSVCTGATVTFTFG